MGQIPPQRSCAILVTSFLCLVPFATADYTTSENDVIERDVAIIGGGASGVYAAFRLRDNKHSIIVIEPQNKLGGQAKSYIGPDGYSTDVGVRVYWNTKLARDFLSRFGIPFFKYSLSEDPITSVPRQFTDFSTGREVVNYIPPTANETAAALVRYLRIRDKYTYLDAGFFLPYPVPEELLMPFGSFLVKYNLEALTPIFVSVNEGYAPLLEIATLYVVKYLSKPEVESLLTGYFTSARHNTLQIYIEARKQLGPDVLLNTRVESLNRGPNGNFVTVNTPLGVKVIRAKKVLITAPPVRLDFEGLNSAETSLFSQFFCNGYYSILLRDTGLPSNISFFAASPSAPLHFPPGSPGVYTVTTNSTTRLTLIYYGTAEPRPDYEVKADVLNVVHRLQVANGYPVTRPVIVSFADHAPYNCMVSDQAIEDRFYERLYALQGQTDTFYTGAAWQTQASVNLWQFFEDFVLPMMLRSLEESY